MYTTSKRANCPGETLLANALDADAKGNFNIAYDFYERGITYYLQVRMVNETNSSIKACIRQTCHQHLQRAEVLKKYMESRAAATLNLTSAEKAYKHLEYSKAYPLFMEGIEKLLESAQIIKPSHPQLSNQLLAECGVYMNHAEEVNKCLHPTPSLQIAVPVSSDINYVDDVEELQCYETDSIEPHKCIFESEQTKTPYKIMKQKDQQHNEKMLPSEEEIKIRKLLHRQRVSALITESHLLLDYLKLDAENEDKLQEMKLVVTQISLILEETDENGTCVVGEHSAERETLENSLQSCQDFLASPCAPPLAEFSEQNEGEIQKDDTRKGQQECLVCCDNIAVMATVPCGHKILCQVCVTDIGDNLATCYLCKTELKEPKCIRIYD